MKRNYKTFSDFPMIDNTIVSINAINDLKENPGIKQIQYIGESNENDGYGVYNATLNNGFVICLYSDIPEEQKAANC